MSNPIFVLLASQILNGENFVKWKSNMNILLICKNYHFVLKEDCPPVPPANAARAVTERYNCWVNANNKHAAVKAVMNGRMKNGSSVRDHVLKMINHLKKAKINGSQINEKTQQFESLICDKGGKANVAEANTAEGRPSSSKNKKKKNQGNSKGKGKKKI
ncbi:uncharacterized protein LOC112092085 [Morus notabilis]|uniref:uncharacterized protein LOC112092085 n=1 Tax=Morus notabilis TaxID=981085 RepID=UPI000CECEC53|nr:uncharacterized protein LOC112092085 [Morus notabilis]